MWLNIIVFSGCIVYDIVNFVSVVNSDWLLLLKNMCDSIVVKYRYSVKLYYFIIVDSVVIIMEVCEILVGCDVLGVFMQVSYWEVRD